MRPFWPFRHFGLKLLSVVIAVLLWMSVSGQEIVERGLRVPLEIQQVPAGIELSGEAPATVDVRVRGESGALSRVGPGDVVAVLDLRAAHAGRRLLPLTPDQVRTPFGVEVVQVQPSAIAMAFEPSATRSVPVLPAVDGRPAPGFIIGEIASDPPTVDVIGPESAVRRVTEAPTAPVAVSGARELVRQTVIIGLVDSTLRLKNARTANVTVQIVPAPLERVLRRRPVQLRNLDPNLAAQAEPATVEVTLRGTKAALDHLEPDDIGVYIDLARLGPGEYMLTAHADSLPDAGVMHVEPALVQVRITSGKR
jgi:YbbR domain-containing protein